MPRLMTQKHSPTWPESLNRTRKRILTLAKHTPSEAIRNDSRARVETSLHSELYGIKIVTVTYTCSAYRVHFFIVHEATSLVLSLKSVKRSQKSFLIACEATSLVLSLKSAKRSQKWTSSSIERATIVGLPRCVHRD